MTGMNVKNSSETKILLKSKRNRTTLLLCYSAVRGTVMDVKITNADALA